MNLDKLVTTDLSALAVDSRQRPIAVDTTLRELGIVREPARDAGIALLATCRLFAGRVGLATAGATALVSVVGFLVFVASYRRPEDGPPLWLALHSETTWGVGLAVVATAMYFVGHWSASRRFARAVALASNPERHGHELAVRADIPAVVLGIAGATVIPVVFGSLWFTIGSINLADVYFERGEGLHAALDPSVVTWLGAAAVAVVGVTIGAIAIGRSVARGRSTALIVAGVALGLVSLVVGFELDVGPLYNRGAVGVGAPSLALRLVLTAAGTAAVFLATTGLVLRRRRRELATGSSPAPSPAPSAEP